MSTDAVDDVEITKRVDIDGLNKAALEYFKKELGKEEEEEDGEE